LDEAKRLLERAIAIDEQHFRADHPALAVSYSNLATVLQDVGGAEHLGKAKRLLERAIAIQEQHFPADHPSLAICYSNLASVLRDLGGAEHRAEAKRLLQRALASFQKHFGDADKRTQIVQHKLRDLADA
jgi:tetratricopeptide (TPR) repeat protein